MSRAVATISENSQPSMRQRSSSDLAFRQDDARDYERLGTVLGVDADAILRVRQVHGRTVLVVDEQRHVAVAADAHRR